MTEHVEPLTERIESTNRHDPYVTRRFEAIFSHADNADVARALTVGLAINDPEREEPAEEGDVVDAEIVEEGDTLTAPSPEEDRPRPLRAFSYLDEFGDRLDVLVYPRGVVVGINGEPSVLVRPEHVDALAAFLDAAVEIGEEETE